MWASWYSFSASSKRFSMLWLGPLPMRLNTRMEMVPSMKPGMISYRPRPIQFFQMITVAAPTTMPARAPLRVMPFHISDRITTGPKAAPKPAQA